MKSLKSTPEAFLELQQEWYDRLAQSGFKDIENTSFQEPALKTWDSCYFQLRHTEDEFKYRAEYYYNARHYLIHGQFISQTHRHIWELHSEGFGLRKISKLLDEKHGVSMSKDKVAKLLLETKKSMKEETA